MDFGKALFQALIAIRKISVGREFRLANLFDNWEKSYEGTERQNFGKFFYEMVENDFIPGVDCVGKTSENHRIYKKLIKETTCKQIARAIFDLKTE